MNIEIDEYHPLKSSIREYRRLIKENDILEVLKYFSQVDIEKTKPKRKKVQKTWISTRREKFNILKHERVNLKGKTCVSCGKWAQCRHHIIAIKHGGSNGVNNLVALCNKCHGEIHPWLKNY